MALGQFLTFEGIDGSGKSTQAKRLAETLRAEGRDVILTREPGGSAGAEEIRALLVEGDPGRWSAETEILLFTAARRDHLERTILPGLQRGAVVISDRFADSTRVYQGAAHPELRRLVDLLHASMIGVEPRQTIIIDMDHEVALKRGLARQSGEDRFEERGADFQKQLRAGFLELAKDEDRCVVIDGMRSQEEVAQDVASAVRSVL